MNCARRRGRGTLCDRLASATARAESAGRSSRHRTTASKRKHSAQHRLRLHDANPDGRFDLITTRVAWIDDQSFHAYVAWYADPFHARTCDDQRDHSARSACIES